MFRMFRVGNLTRSDSVVEALCSTRSPEIMIMLLNSNDFDILLAVTGALVNISADSRSMECLAESEKPALALASVLRKSSFKQLHISTLICQVQFFRFCCLNESHHLPLCLN